MRNDNDFTPASTPPKRQGFYEVKLAQGEPFVADWRERDAKQGKVWWRHVSDDPTAEKKPVLLVGVIGWRNTDKATIEAALKREPTVAEKIEAAVQAHQRDLHLYKYDPIGPPANRTLRVGDDIELGALKNCKVVELRNDGRIVVFSYNRIDSNYGKPIDQGTHYMAVHWTNTVALDKCRNDAVVKDSTIYDGYRTTTLSSLLSRQLRGLNDSPVYQRGYRWTEVDQQRLLESLFAGREIGRFMFVDNPYPQLDEVLDGKQRLHCLWLFYTSQIAYKGLYWHELSIRDRDHIENRTVQYVDLPGTRFKKSDLLTIFLEVNAAGVPQTEDHLTKVRQQRDECLALEAQASKAKAA